MGPPEFSFSTSRKINRKKSDKSKINSQGYPSFVLSVALLFWLSLALLLSYLSLKPNIDGLLKFSAYIRCITAGVLFFYLLSIFSSSIVLLSLVCFVFIRFNIS